MLSLLGSAYEWVPVDILGGETQTPAFLEKNPNGKIPVLELEDGMCLWESMRFSIFWPMAPATCQVSRVCGHKCCSGSFSSSTATSRR